MGTKKKDKLVILACGDCKRRNYTTERNKKNSDRLEISKYCPFCSGHKLHKETK